MLHAKNIFLCRSKEISDRIEGCIDQMVFLKSVKGILVVIIPGFPIWHYLCPKSFTIQFFFNFSHFIGLKMHGREGRVNASELGTKTPGRQVIMGLDWRERPHPSPFPEAEAWPRSQASLQGASPPLCPGSSLLPVRLRFSSSVQPSKDAFSLRLFLFAFITKWASSEFSVGLSSSNCIFRPRGWFCNWGMSAWVGHKCF